MRSLSTGSKPLDIEANVREILEKEVGRKLIKTRLQVGHYGHEFDLCSKDREIAGEIKSGRDLAASGRISSYRLAEICLDCLHLLSLKAKRKILVLTDRQMYEEFLKETKDMPLNGVEVRLIEPSSIAKSDVDKTN